MYYFPQRFILICTFLLFAAACSSSSSVEEAADDGHWYNSFGLKSVFGDFDTIEPRSIVDEVEAKELVGLGSYLANGPAACGACHGLNPGDPSSSLAGGLLINDRFGEVRVPNITPSLESGIGKWNFVEIMRAIRSSIDRAGRPLSIDAHQGYRWMSDRDAKAIALYLLTLEPFENRVERRRLGGIERNSFAVLPQHREVEGYVTAMKEGVGFERGMYLAESVSQCIVCHTGREGVFSSAEPFAGGAINFGSKSSVFTFEVLKRFFKGEERVDDATAGLISEDGKSQLNIESAGGKELPEVKQQKISKLLEAGAYPVPGPDIRGNSDKGLASWLEKDIIDYLTTGSTPYGASVDGRLCPWPFYSSMSEKDKQAIAGFLKKL